MRVLDTASLFVFLYSGSTLLMYRSLHFLLDMQYLFQMTDHQWRMTDYQFLYHWSEWMVNMQLISSIVTSRKSWGWEYTYKKSIIKFMQENIDGSPLTWRWVVPGLIFLCWIVGTTWTKCGHGFSPYWLLLACTILRMYCDVMWLC